MPLRSRSRISVATCSGVIAAIFIEPNRGSSIRCRGRRGSSCASRGEGVRFDSNHCSATSAKVAFGRRHLLAAGDLAPQFGLERERLSLAPLDLERSGPCSRRCTRESRRRGADR